MKWFKRREKRELTDLEREEKKKLAEDAAMYSMFASNTQPQSAGMTINGKGGGFDISNPQKIAAYNLLMNDKE